MVCVCDTIPEVEGSNCALVADKNYEKKKKKKGFLKILFALTQRRDLLKGGDTVPKAS